MENTPGIEIMAPAGSFEALRAAIQAGAGSVYFGVGELNMRARAANFQPDDLEKIVRICKENGVRSYLTVNTIVYDDEFDTVRALCDRAKKAGVSAIIAMDISVIEYARQIGLEVHMSTQANISNIEAVAFYARYTDVVVLARELTLERIRHICHEIERRDIRGPRGELVQVEVFVHGALCIAVSGKCYMSLTQKNSAANRGACHQTCRRTFTLKDTISGQELELDNEYVMSPSDLCTLGQLEKIIETGATVLKIEGRGRSPEYVYTVVEAYTGAVRDIQNGTYTDDKKTGYIEQVKTVFNRGFWHGGYYLGIPTGEWAGVYGSKATTRKVFLGEATNYYARNGIGEFMIRTGGFAIGDELMVIGPTTGVLQFTATSIRTDDGQLDECKKGDWIGVPVPEKIRRNDQLFVIRPAEDVAE